MTKRITLKMSSTGVGRLGGSWLSLDLRQVDGIKANENREIELLVDDPGELIDLRNAVNKVLDNMGVPSDAERGDYDRCGCGRLLVGHGMMFEGHRLCGRCAVNV